MNAKVSIRVLMRGGWMETCWIPRREVKTLPVTADNIFCVTLVSVSCVGRMWSWGGPILSWRWPVECDAADEVAISARVGLAGERKCRRYQEDCIFVVVACIKDALRCMMSLSMDLNFLVDG